jgi:hypothetical protein
MAISNYYYYMTYQIVTGLTSSRKLICTSGLRFVDFRIVVLFSASESYRGALGMRKAFTWALGALIFCGPVWLGFCFGFYGL